MRVRSSYHTLQLLKAADPILRKAIISKCNKELGNCISECALNVLNGNIKLTCCDTRKLQNTRRRFASSSTGTCLSDNKELIVQRGFVLPLLSTFIPTLASLILRNR